MTNRRGFTMVELMIGLILTIAVGGVIYQMLLRNHRVNRAQTEHIGVQDNVRSGALIVANELREVGYDVISAEATAKLGYAPVPATRTDLLFMGPGALEYRATRGLGFVCQVSTAAPATVVVRLSTWQALRGPTDKDTLMLYIENESNTANDDAWVHLGISATANQSCPGAGTPAGLAFQVQPPAGLNITTALDAVVLGGPVRLTEVMRLEQYQTDGKSYLGLRSVSAGGALQPVVGPLSDNVGAVRGLTFVYRDANNVETAVAASVRAIEVTLRGVTDQAIHARSTYQAAIDTLGLTTRVALRNTLQ